MSIFVSSEGDAGTKVSIHKAMLLSALTIDTTGDALQAATYGSANQTDVFTFANPSSVIELGRFDSDLQGGHSKYCRT